MATPTVDVILTRADVPTATLESLQLLLGDSDLRRYHAYRRPDDRRRHIVAHAALRSRLAPLVGDTPQALRLVRGPNGKPERPGGPFFSLSHSGEYVAIAVSTMPIGVDVQEHRAIGDHILFAKTYFSEPEISRLKAAAWAACVFFEIWTAKEAVAKGDGRGTALGLQKFAVPIMSSRPSRVVDLGCDPPLSKWHIARFDVAPGYSGTVAAMCDKWRPESRLVTAAEILAGL